MSRSSERSEEEILPLPLRYPLLSQGQGQNDKRRRAQSQSFGSGQALASPLKGGKYYRIKVLDLDFWICSGF